MKDFRAGPDDLAEASGKCVKTPEGREIALFKSDGRLYAMDNVCPHRGAPLAEGHLEGNVVTCPWHAWQFNVTTGACLTVPASRAHAYPVRVEGGEILIRLD